MSKDRNRYDQTIEAVFLKYHKDGQEKVPFTREDLIQAAEELGINVLSNLGDVIYTYRFRKKFPDRITKTAPPGAEWVIRLKGDGEYEFSLTDFSHITQNKMLSETKIPDSTPGIIERYAFNDEQGLLAKLRYNRLIDIFLGITCYSLQSHLRTNVPNFGQIETDEIYVGLDKRGVHYVIPVQAKAGNDRLGIVQIEQDFALCQYKFHKLTCIPVAAQFIKDDLISMVLCRILFLYSFARAARFKVEYRGWVRIGYVE